MLKRYSVLMTVVVLLMAFTVPAAMAGPKGEDRPIKADTTGFALYGADGGGTYGLLNVFDCDEAAPEKLPPGFEYPLDDEGVPMSPEEFQAWFQVTTYTSADGMASHLGKVHLEAVHCPGLMGPVNGQLGRLHSPAQPRPQPRMSSSAGTPSNQGATSTAPARCWHAEPAWRTRQVRRCGCAPDSCSWRGLPPPRVYSRMQPGSSELAARISPPGDSSHAGGTWSPRSGTNSGKRSAIGWRKRQPQRPPAAVFGWIDGVVRRPSRAPISRSIVGPGPTLADADADLDTRA